MGIIDTIISNLQPDSPPKLMSENLLRYESFIYDADDPETSEMLGYFIANDIVMVGADDERMFVICSDTFWWGTADGETITFKELRELFDLCREHGNDWGSTIWCSLKRQMRPMWILEQRMKKAGVWTDEMEALPERKINDANPRYEDKV